jgi:hypothetical protein
MTRRTTGRSAARSPRGAWPERSAAAEPVSMNQGRFTYPFFDFQRKYFSNASFIR